jgi:rSAM/selenodomain-associated transferase 2
MVIVIPVYDDDPALARLLDQFESIFNDHGGTSFHTELIVVDGMPLASTQKISRTHNVTYRTSERGRGNQIVAGLKDTRADWAWVVHADSDINRAAFLELQSLIAVGQPKWGRFNVEIEGLGWLSFMMNLRSRQTQICTGDQAMFFHTRLLADIGGFPEQPLMEDIEVSRRLKKSCHRCFVALNERIQTSPRRWREQGTVKTVLLMWWFRGQYWMGVSASRLYQKYYRQ